MIDAQNPDFFTRSFGVFARPAPPTITCSLSAELAEALRAEADAAERFPHAMVDIETMANHTSRSLILSVAAIPFALDAAGPRFGPTLLILPELSEQLATGRLVTRDTQDFWGKAGPKARRHWNGPRDRTPVWSVGPDLRAFLHANTTGRSAQIWFRGQGFDAGNLDNLADEHGEQPPWPAFWMLRDQRTATTFFPRRRARPQDVVIEGDPHDPIHDCRQQIWTLWEHAPEDAFGLPENLVRAPVAGQQPDSPDLLNQARREPPPPPPPPQTGVMG